MFALEGLKPGDTAVFARRPRAPLEEKKLLGCCHVFCWRPLSEESGICSLWRTPVVVDGVLVRTSGTSRTRHLPTASSVGWLFCFFRFLASGGWDRCCCPLEVWRICEKMCIFSWMLSNRFESPQGCFVPNHSKVDRPSRRKVDRPSRRRECVPSAPVYADHHHEMQNRISGMRNDDHRAEKTGGGSPHFPAFAGACFFSPSSPGSLSPCVQGSMYPFHPRSS